MNQGFFNEQGSFSTADQLAEILSICASLLAVVFIISLVATGTSNVPAGATGCGCILLSRSMEDILEVVSRVARSLFSFCRN